MTTMTVRTDSAVEQAVEFLLAQHVGQTRSDVVRTAVLELERVRRRELLRAESAALRANPVEQEAARATAAEMARLGAW